MVSNVQANEESAMCWLGNMYKYKYIKTNQHQYEGNASNFLWEKNDI